jgi:formyltetrahydrofolate deformylase
MGRLPITCPDRPGIGTGLSSFPFSGGASITGSQPYSTDPSGGTFFARIEFHLNPLAERFANPGSAFGELAGKFSMRWKMRPEPGPPAWVRS